MAERGGARPNSGRKSKDEENKIRDLMKPYSLDAVKCLANIIVNDKSRDSDKISAAKLIIEYTYDCCFRYTALPGEVVNPFFS